MAVLAVDEVMLREPRLLVPRGSPVGKVKMDLSSPLARGCLWYIPFCEMARSYRNIASGRPVDRRAGYEQFGPEPATKDGLSCADNAVNTYAVEHCLRITDPVVTLDGVTMCIELYRTTSYVALDTPLSLNPSTAVQINAGAYNDATRLGMHWNNAYYTWTGGPVIPVGEWTLCALTRQPGAGNTTIDAHVVSRSGGYASASPGTGAVPTILTPTIGGEPTYNRMFRGAIANVRLYSRALSRTELQELFYNPYQMLVPA